MRFLLMLFFICAEVVLSAKEEVLRVFLASEATTSAMKGSTSADVAKMKKFFQTTAKKIKMKLVMNEVHGREFTLDRLLDWIHSLKSEKDTAVFYYSGKGLNLSKNVGSESKCPYVFVTFDGKVLYFSEEDIAQEIKKQNPRFSLVLADCYDKRVGSIKKFSLKANHKKLSISKSGLKTLFVKSKGMVIACSGEKVQNCYFSTIPHFKGGVFTSSFLEGLCSETFSKKARWDKVMIKSWQQCHKGKQDPLVGILSEKGLKKFKH